jgi:RNA polymerase sigma-70 factor (ECF subfamily)
MALSDDQIVEKIRGGAKHHYRHLVERYKDRGMTLALRILRNREDAEEALQDAFVRAFRGLDQFKGDSKFATWFYRILYNACLSMLEKRNPAVTHVEWEENREYGFEETGGSIPLSAEIEMRDLAEIVKRIIESMPEKYAAILTLFYLRELSHDEICAILDLPLGTVKTHLFRARAMLHKRLQNEIMVGVSV